MRVPAIVLTGVGVAAVVLGGLVAAVTGPLAVPRGSWMAAFLVLPLGVAQVGMGLARLAAPDTGRDAAWLQLASWNVGGVVVILGTLMENPFLVDGGAVLLVVALVVAFLGARLWQGWLAIAYRALLILLIVSIPVGLVLSHLRHA